ncbi:MAG: hypothetical protein BWY74_02684 [Firmicutes bacterium ADurb.Bin419]|nr:MAG: hypothetical protein BWY74_02684 [Firmicutes bacterium ADurb.Bin419]
MYILHTPYFSRQHDVAGIGNIDGHLAYIEYFFHNNFKLPDFDPRTKWQFYHPPLHHFISAVWLKLNSALGMNFEKAVESIQVLTLFYSCCINILCYKIFKEFSLDKLALVIPYSIVCFHPTLSLLSGSINNDILCLALMLAAILYTIRWYKNPAMSTIIKIALFMGLSMMAKSSGILLAPAIASVFLLKLAQRKDLFKKFIGQFTVFGLICIPLGVWWSVYNYTKYGMPLGYIPLIDDNPALYIGDYSVINRFFDFDPVQIKNIFICFGDPYKEHNILIYILKSSVFGEYHMKDTTVSMIISTILFYINAFLIFISLISMGVATVKKSSKIDTNLKTFWIILYVTITASFIRFCFGHPLICTQDYRYIVPTFIIGSLAIGFALDFLQAVRTKRAKFFAAITTATTVVFCLSSILVYLILD